MRVQLTIGHSAVSACPKIQRVLPMAGPGIWHPARVPGQLFPFSGGPRLNPRLPSGNLPGWLGGNPHQLGNRRYYRAGTPGRGLTQGGPRDTRLPWAIVFRP